MSAEANDTKRRWDARWFQFRTIIALNKLILGSACAAVFYVCMIDCSTELLFVYRIMFCCAVSKLFNSQMLPHFLCVAWFSSALIAFHKAPLVRAFAAVCFVNIRICFLLVLHSLRVQSCDWRRGCKEENSRTSGTGRRRWETKGGTERRSATRENVRIFVCYFLLASF